MCKMLSSGCGSMEQTCKPGFTQCYFCGGSTNSFKIISNETDSIHGRTSYSDVHLNARKKVNFLAGLIYIITILMLTLFIFVMW